MQHVGFDLAICPYPYDMMASTAAAMTMMATTMASQVLSFVIHDLPELLFLSYFQ